MEESGFATKKSRVTTALTHGLLVGFAIIVLFVVFYLLNDPANQIINYLNFAIMLAGIIISTIVWRNEGLDGYITYGQAVGIGSLTMVFAALVNAIFLFLFLQFIAPDAKQMFMAAAEEQTLRRTPEISDDQLDAMLALTERMFTPVILGISTFFSVAGIGLIFSLITSAFLKKKNPDPFA